MSLTHTIVEIVSTAGRTLTKQNSYSGGSQLTVSEPIADSETDYEIAFALDVSEIAAIYIVSDQDVLFETNDGSSPDDTISLKAGVPYIWTEDSYHVCLLTTDITSIFITNASGAAAQLEIEVVFDPTP